MSFKTDHERAVAYAAYKSLERLLEKDGELPPGFYEDVTGITFSITLPKGSVVSRDKGMRGDGIILKKAVQNIYGYALWAMMILRLKKFHQWRQIRQALLDAMRETIRRKRTDFRKEIEKEYPEVVEEIESLINDLGLPQREEQTPRLFPETDLPATITIHARKKQVA